MAFWGTGICMFHHAMCPTLIGKNCFSVQTSRDGSLVPMNKGLAEREVSFSDLP